MFLRDRKKSDGSEWWVLVLAGVVLCGISLLGFAGAFGEEWGSGRLQTLVVIGIPLGPVLIVIGIVKLFRDDRPRGDGGSDPEERAGDRPEG